MPNGRLAAIDITTTGSPIQIFQVPAGKTTSFSLTIVNRNSSNAKIRIWLADTASPAAGEAIAWDEILYPADQGQEPLQRVGLVLGENQYLFVQTDTANISVVAWGFEEDDT